jgi:hypothetical protein
MTVAGYALILLLAAPAISRSSDEIVAVAEACGKPQWIRRAPQPQAGPGAAIERLHYSSLDLIFQRDKPGSLWKLNRATLPGSDNALAHEDAFRAMPCLNKISTLLPVAGAIAATALTSPPPTQPVSPERKRIHFPVSIVGAIFALLAVSGALVLYVWRRTGTLEQESGWLCMNCYTICEPAKSEDGEVHCAVCSYGTPVPFESAEAKEYFTASGFKPRESP